MTYKVLSSLTANNVNSADLLKVKTDLLIIAVNKKTSAAPELKGLQSSAQSLVKESIKEINGGSRKSIFLPAPAKVAAKKASWKKKPGKVEKATSGKNKGRSFKRGLGGRRVYMPAHTISASVIQSWG